MKKGIMMAAANWLRKPENQQKAKSAWNRFRDRNSSKQATQKTPNNTNERRSGNNHDDRP